MEAIKFENLADHVGEETGVSDWLEISQDRVNQFAEATGDHQWIHVDVEKATELMGGPIAHGYLTLSLIPHLGMGMRPIDGVTRGINYGCNKVRFTNMVPVGSKVRMRQVLKSVEEKGGGLLMTNTCTIEIEGQDRPACVAETLSVIYNN